jgi:hypothetical protein
MNQYEHLTYDEWCDKYKVKTDDEDCVLGFEPREITVEDIQGHGGGQFFWTEYDDGGISSGLQVVNRNRYLVTQKPWSDGVVTIVESDHLP